MPYFSQGHKKYNFLRHLILMYGDAKRPWAKDDLRYYVAHINENNTPDDWLYDSFLFLNIRADSGNDYVADVNHGTTMSGEGDFFAMCSPHPANKRDWEDLLEFYLGPNGALRTLDATIDECEKQIGSPCGSKRNVVLMLPYPHITQHEFGALTEGGKSLDFSIGNHNLAQASRDRLEAEKWFVDEVVKRYRSQNFEHIHLLGVYWMFETVYRGWDVDDHWMLKELRTHINANGLKFLWIPYWSAYNIHLLDEYQNYYFDLAFLQPNYMFYKEGKTIEQAAFAARKRHAGIEMEYYLELNEPIAIQGERQERFREYLNGGVTYGYMNDAVCAHFQGVGSLERMHKHADPVEREFYEDIYHFIKGNYRLKPSIGTVEQKKKSVVALAIDLGGTNLRGAIVTSAGDLYSRTSYPTPKTKEELLQQIISVLKELKAEAEHQGSIMKGIGVSSGGRVDFENGEIMDSTALLADWQHVSLRELVRAELHLPVWVDNDGNCAALAEQVFGKGRSIANFITLVLGTGIGGGVVVDGKVLRGARNAAAELGHISIQYDGPVCSCGNRGCVELFASGSGLANLARELMKSGTIKLNGLDQAQVNAQTLADAAKRGNKVAQQLVERAGTMLGVATAGLVNTFNPERIILSGSLTQIGDMYLKPFADTVQSRAMKVAKDSVEIMVSDLSDPGLLGAAGLVFG